MSPEFIKPYNPYSNNFGALSISAGQYTLGQPKAPVVQPSNEAKAFTPENKQESFFEKLVNSVFGLISGGASTEDMEKASAAIDELNAFQDLETDDSDFDKGLKMHQAFKNDPETQQYAKYDRELYSINDYKTYALA